MWHVSEKKGIYFLRPHNTKRYMHLYVHSSIICNCQGMKQPMDSSIDGILLSHKKEWNIAICSNMGDLEIIILSEVSQREKDKYYTISLTCVKQTSE